MSKICFISSNEGGTWGGSEELWFLTSAYLKKRGLDVSVNVKRWNPNPPKIEVLAEIGCKIHQRERRNGLWRLATARFLGLNSTNDFLHWMRTERPNLVVFSLGNNFEGLVWMEACLEEKVPYTILLQLAFNQKWPGDQNLDRYAKVYSSAVRCFFVSSGNRKFVEKILGLSLSNVALVHNPFNVPYNIDFTWPDQDEGLKMACVGRLYALHKGQDILFEVLRQDKWKRRKIEVNLFGEGLHEKLLQRLKGLWDLQNVYFRGHVDGIQHIWEHHHLKILPSRFEGSPLAVIEAMMCGRPCIVTDVGGNRELVEDGVTGFVAKAPIAKLLDEAMERAWNNRDKLEIMGQAAYTSIRKKIPANPEHKLAEELIALIT